MKCPKCKSEILSKNINVTANVFYCEYCNEAMPLSSYALNENPESFSVDSPPSGVSMKRLSNGFEIKASTRSIISFFLVPFLIFWSGGSLGALFYSFFSLDIDSESRYIFLAAALPFLVASIFLIMVVMIYIAGYYCIKVVNNNGEIFLGVGGIGKRKLFHWDDVDIIKEYEYQGRNKNGAGIVMEGKKRIKFGSFLNPAKRFYLVNALKYFKNN